jgi:DNA (cytosine-5)-methyltransferase 1
LKVIDMFAGAGGFSTGAKMAGLNVVWAGNHWPEAVACHQANHPETLHTTEDLIRLDWTTVPKHDILLASPACQGHSRARGKDRPHHDGLRATAWAVIDALEVHQPELVVIENVKEFQTKWVNYPTWELALTRLGYRVTSQLLNAADFGVPQARERLFVVAHRKKAIHIINPKLPHVPARDIIQWDAGKWGAIERARPLSERTMGCIRSGQNRYGKRFLVPYYGNEFHARSVDKALGTIMTVDTFMVVDGDRCRMMNLDEYKLAMSFPADYQLARRHKDAVKMVGNAVCPGLAKAILLQALS